MRSNSFFIKLLSVVLIFSLIGCGGSKLYLLPNSENIDVPNSDRIVATTYNINILSYPSTNDPTFTIAIEKKDRIESDYYNTSTEVVKEWSYPTAGHIFTFTVGWVALMPLYFYLINNKYKLNGEKEINIQPTTLRGSIPNSSLIYQNAPVNIEWSPTGKLVKGDIHKSYSDKKVKIIESKVKIVGNNISNLYDISKEGTIKINIIKDFEIKPSPDNRPIIFKFFNLNNKELDTISLDIEKWMAKYIRIELLNEMVLNEIDGQLVTLAEVNRGDVFKVIHQGREFIKIDYFGKDGFLSPNCGEVFWALENYLELNN